jgi:hypothetical protein
MALRWPQPNSSERSIKASGQWRSLTVPVGHVFGTEWCTTPARPSMASGSRSDERVSRGHVNWLSRTRRPFAARGRPGEPGRTLTECCEVPIRYALGEWVSDSAWRLEEAGGVPRSEIARPGHGRPNQTGWRCLTSVTTGWFSPVPVRVVRSVGEDHLSGEPRSVSRYEASMTAPAVPRRADRRVGTRETLPRLRLTATGQVVDQRGERRVELGDRATVRPALDCAPA